jgi:hypothetical protein
MQLNVANEQVDMLQQEVIGLEAQKIELEQELFEHRKLYNQEVTQLQEDLECRNQMYMDL